MQLRHILFIALKDLRLFIKDRLALLFFLLFPFLFVLLFYFVLGGAGTQDKRLELHLVTSEQQGLSQEIIRAIETKDETHLKPGQPKIVWDRSYDDNLKAVQNGKLAGFVAFPEDFTSGVMAGAGARLEVVADPEETYMRAALEGLARGIAADVGARHVAVEAVVALLLLQEQGVPADPSQIQQLFGSAGMQAESLIAFDEEKVGEIERENPSNYVIPGYLVMFVFFGAALAAETIVRERRNGTLERLLASSVRRESILGGIYAGTAAKGLIQIFIFWVVGILVFNIDLGRSPAAVLILSMLMVLMSAAFGIMLATLARTERSAGSVAVITSLVLAPLGGCWWPLFITPKWMQFMAKITPHGWATTGFNKLMVFGGDFGSAVPEMLALLVFAIVFIAIAVQRFRISAV